MAKRFAAIAFAIAILPIAVAARETTLTAILSTLEKVQRLRQMDNAATYELEARGAKMSGVSDDFLRRRTPDEILRSGLACGCGDYAYAFYSLMKSRGFEVLYIDAVGLNLQSILEHDYGHTAVAVKDRQNPNWILVDPTSNKIVSGDWDDKQRLYIGPASRFWIGYAGPLEDYPVMDHAGLQRFYEETLATVPKSVWRQELLGVQFVVDGSLKTSGGGFTNPRLAEFMRRPQSIYAGLGVVPLHAVKITLVDAGDSEPPEPCRKVSENDWTCALSRTQGLNPSMNDWIANRILWSE